MTKQSTPVKPDEQSNKVKHEIYWAIPMGHTLGVEAFRGLLGVAQVCGAYHYNNIPMPYMRTDLARNSIVKSFLTHSKNADDVLVMLDNDHIHPATVVRDLATMDHEFGVTAALAFRRGEPFDPLMFVRTPEDGKLHPIAGWEEGVCIQCQMVGHGAIAIKRWVFDKLSEAGYGPNFYRYQYRDDGTAPSEDMFFGEACEAVGIYQYCRTDIVIPHITNYYIDQKDWYKWLADHPGNVRQQDNPDEPEQTGISGGLSIIIPSKGRAAQLKRMIVKLLETVKGQEQIEIMVIAGADDAETIAAATEAGASVETMPLDHNAIEAWNYGAARAQYNWIMLGADDLWFEEGWFDDVMATTNRGFIGLPDGHTDPQLATHYLATRYWLGKYNGGVLAIPKYRSWFIDVEISERARLSNTYAYCNTTCIEHRHAVWHTAPDDATYQRGRAFQEKDRELFAERKLHHFPNDFDPVITVPQWS